MGSEYFLRNLRFMSMTVKKISEAIGTGELITIIYHGGSQPGTVREIFPLQINDNMVQARCYSSNKVKTFDINKIEISPNQLTESATWDVDAKHPYAFESIKHAYEGLKNDLENLGWNVQFTENGMGDHAVLSIHDFFKNGKVRKTPKVAIGYSSFITNFDYGVDSGDFIETTKKSARPYSVGSISFGKIERGIERFMSEVRKLSPQQPSGK